MCRNKVFYAPFFRKMLLPSCLAHGVNEAGCDEAGRGCLAGPVVAAAVILPEGFGHPLLNDSKKLSEKQREEARDIIMNNAIDYSIAWCSPAIIDDINILNASIMAMHKALTGLIVIPQHVIVDGNRFKPWNFVPYTTIVKGDAKFANIAAASILAKTTRDSIMSTLDHKLPAYGFASHKGYPTKSHYDALKKVGPSPWHRLTFKGVIQETDR